MSVLPTFPMFYYLIDEETWKWEKVPVFAQRTSKTGYDLSVLSNVALKNREYSTRRINQRKFQGYIVVWYHTGPHTQQVCPASIKKILVESYGNADQVYVDPSNANQTVPRDSSYAVFDLLVSKIFLGTGPHTLSNFVLVSTRAL